jgi:hypothetical protein
VRPAAMPSPWPRRVVRAGAAEEGANRGVTDLAGAGSEHGLS